MMTGSTTKFNYDEKQNDAHQGDQWCSVIPNDPLKQCESGKFEIWPDLQKSEKNRRN